MLNFSWKLRGLSNSVCPPPPNTGVYGTFGNHVYLCSVSV